MPTWQHACDGDGKRKERKEAWAAPSEPRTDVRNAGILKHKAAVYTVSNLDDTERKKYEGQSREAAAFKQRRKTSADIAIAKAPPVCCCSLQ